MSTDKNIGDKRALTEAEISDFLSTIEKRRVDAIDESFSTDDIASMSFVGNSLVDAVGAIVNYPSKFQVDEFKRRCLDNKLLNALQNPYVSKVLELKQLYDLDALPIFKNILSVGQRNPFQIEEDPIIRKTIDESRNYYAEPPIISSSHIKEQFKDKDNLANYISVGRRQYDAIVSEILAERFYDREIEELTIHVEDNRLTKHWNNLYVLQAADDYGILYHDNFHAFIGCLIKSGQQEEVKEWLTILLEPLLIQFDSSLQLTEDACAKLTKTLPESTCKTLFISKHEEKPIYIVQYRYFSKVLGTASDASLVTAEQKAASYVLYNKDILAIAQDWPKEEKASAKVESESGFGAKTASFTINGSTKAEPATAASTSNSAPSQHQSQTYNSQYGHAGHSHNGYGGSSQRSGYQNVQQVVQQQYGQPVNLTQVSAAPTRGATLLKESGLTDPHEPIDPSVYKFSDPPDETVIDNSSKEKLNSYLISKKLSPAEYKTAKVSNSEVQVTCLLQGRPVARATATNKKKAGQWVAQNIMEFIDYFLSMVENAEREDRANKNGAL